MRTPEQILQSIVDDVNAMRLKHDKFGPFDGDQSHKDYSVDIYWPNLDILVKEAEEALEEKQ